MCTVTFILREVGYYLAMNRDEQLARIAGVPPQRRFVSRSTVLCPSEPGGGTWISLNDARASFALINWYSVPGRVKGEGVSRGEVVRRASACCAPGEAEEGLSGLPLNLINPFRLIGVFRDGCEIVEWKWDLKNFVRQRHPWKPQQWISSGYDEPMARAARNLAFQRAQREDSAGTVEWLRRLHRSHHPKCGPFSTCMHRADAATVSYTEISVTQNEATMGYRSGQPCVSSRDVIHETTVAATPVDNHSQF